MTKRQKRFEILGDRAVNKDGFIKEWTEVGLVAMESPNDPKPSIRIEGGRCAELDGKSRRDFDMIDTWIADHVIDVSVADEAMAIESLKVAQMLVDINVPRSQIVRLSVGMTPAKYVDVLRQMNVVELMMAMQKLRPRRTPSNQAHVTNVKDTAPLLAADAAEAAWRGFSEIETTVGVGRYAPMNALSLLVGGQVGRPGVLAQCAVEEALELTMGMRGLTHYAETVSVYGTEQVFVDGDDTPWSKVANPDKGVVVACGDGGFMFGVQELATAVQFNINLVTVIFDNGGFENVRRDQSQRFGGRDFGADLVNPDFVKMAESFGAKGVRVTGAGALERAIEEGFGELGPVIIVVPVDARTESSPWPFVHPSPPA